MSELIAGLRGINHKWQRSGTVACRDISLDLQPGCIHALVGENGAGKTTLGHILSGVREPDSGFLNLGAGEINLAGRSIGLFDEIGLIRQRSIWPGVLTVREASVIGRKGCPRSIRDQKRLFEQTAEQWGLEDIDPGTIVSKMGAAALQRAEMVAALMFNPQILVLDEPASAWEEGRGEEFFRLLKALRDSGRSILLITHRLEDVFNIADSVTVMRRGSLTGTWAASETDYTSITREMFGEEGLKARLPDRESQPAGASDSETMLEARNIDLTIAGRQELDKVNFHLQQGEILGIAGLKEEGLSFLEDVISGNRQPGSGNLLVNSKPIHNGAAGMRRAGLHYVPSDKTGRGASLDSTMSENMIVLESGRLAKHGWLNPRRIHNWTESRRNAGGISGEPDQKLDELSGGNIQKVILQREINNNTRLLVVADPTWGLDEMSKQQVHRKLLAIRNSGAAVLLLASDLDEALHLSDRMGVINGGHLSDIRPTGNWNRNEAAEMITGGQR